MLSSFIKLYSNKNGNYNKNHPIKEKNIVQNVGII